MRVLAAFVLLVLPLASGCLEQVQFAAPACNVSIRGGSGAGGWNGDGSPGEPAKGARLRFCDVSAIVDEAADTIRITSVGSRSLGWEDVNVTVDAASVQVWLAGANATPLMLGPGASANLGGLSNAPLKVGDALSFCAERLQASPVQIGLGGSGWLLKFQLGALATCTPVVHAFEACDELDFYRTVPYSSDGLGFFRPVAADPAGVTMNLLYTVMRCAGAGGTLSNKTGPTAIFSLLVVEPLQRYRLPEAAGYQLLRAVTTDDEELARDWAAFGVQVARAPVGLSFADGVSGPKSSAALSVDSPLHSVAAQSLMAGQPAMGKAGKLGLYTATSHRPYLHTVEFSDYSYYSRGVAILQPGPMVAPANIVPAYHNLGFDATFRVAGIDDVPSTQHI